MDSNAQAGSGFRPLQERKFLRVGIVFGLAAIGSAFFALSALVASRDQNHLKIHWSKTFFIAIGAAVVLGLLARLFVMLHHARQDAAFEELLRLERERGFKD
jgi:hypothetical protein